MLKMYNSNYGFTVETKRVHNITMPFVQKIVRKSFDPFSHYSGHIHCNLQPSDFYFYRFIFRHLYQQIIGHSLSKWPETVSNSDAEQKRVACLAGTCSIICDSLRPLRSFHVQIRSWIVTRSSEFENISTLIVKYIVCSAGISSIFEYTYNRSETTTKPQFKHLSNFRTKNE